MALVSPLKMIKKAQQNKYAIGAFNIINYETLKAVIDAAEHTKSPIICQISERSITKYIDFEYFVPMAIRAAQNAKVDVALQLDNGTNFAIIKKAISYGFTSVMFDGSHHKIERNLIETAEIVAYAHKHKVIVEGEIGIFSVSDNDKFTDKERFYANPQKVKEFVNKTKVDMLAVAFGSQYGRYQTEPQLNFEILEETRNLTDCPIVMHGASGIDFAKINKAIKLGVAKVNVETDLLITYTKSLETFFEHNPNVFDIRSAQLAAIEEMKSTVVNYLKTFGSINKN